MSGGLYEYAFMIFFILLTPLFPVIIVILIVIVRLSVCLILGCFVDRLPSHVSWSITGRANEDVL